MCSQFCPDYFRSYCSHKYVTAGGFLLEVHFPSWKCDQRGVGKRLSSMQEAARGAEITLWKSQCFLYSMLKMADEAPCCVYLYVSTFAERAWKATYRLAERTTSHRQTTHKLTHTGAANARKYLLTRSYIVSHIGVLELLLGGWVKHLCKSWVNSFISDNITVS